MLAWGDVHRVMIMVTERHQRLLGHFTEFARIVEAEFHDPGHRVKGISVRSDAENALVDMKFAQQTVRFFFSVRKVENNSLIGVVTFWRMPRLPSEEPTKLGEIIYDGQGQTNIIDEAYGGYVVIDDNAGAVLVALNAIHDSVMC